MPNAGKIKQIIGAVVDVQFKGKLLKYTMPWN
jgi:F0F1-type ATP synthase beta subunit